MAGPRALRRFCSCPDPRGAARHHLPCARSSAAVVLEACGPSLIVQCLSCPRDERPGIATLLRCAREPLACRRALRWPGGSGAAALARVSPITRRSDRGSALPPSIRTMSRGYAAITLQLASVFQANTGIRQFEPVIRPRAVGTVALPPSAPPLSRERLARVGRGARCDGPGVTFARRHAPTNTWYDLRLILRFGLDYPVSPLRTTVSHSAGRAARQRTPGAAGVADGGVKRACLRILVTHPASAERPCRRIAHSRPNRGPRPDVTPARARELGSEQPVCVLIAPPLLLPTVLCTGSWDTFHSRGDRAVPSRVIVWNDTQKPKHRDAGRSVGGSTDRAHCFGC